MVIIDRLRDFHDDIVFRHYPDIRKHARHMYSAVFLIILATLLGTTYIGEATTIAKPQIRADIDSPALGAKLRLLRFTDRPVRAPAPSTSSGRQ